MSSDSHNTLGNGEWLLNGHSLWSNDGSVEFKMQGDGKIAIYWGGQCRWQNTAEQRSDVKGIKMQEDGNLCMYDNNGKPIWHTDTAGSTGDSTVIAAVQNDGNVVLYRGTPIWSSKTSK
ncbi:Curculin-2 [Arthrobotrys entomopaga]|nr:Curculin-2 [Arthrobotrys entomopaga]